MLGGADFLVELRGFEPPTSAAKAPARRTARRPRFCKA